MIKTKNICIYLKDNKIIYCIDNEYGLVNFKSIIDSKIVNQELFINEFSQFIRNKKINNNLFGDTIYYLSIDDSLLEISLIKEILHRFSFKNTIIIDLLDILNENTYVISLKKKYILLSKNEKYSIPKVYSNIIIDLLENIEYKKIYILGDSNIFNVVENAYSIYTPKDFLLTKLKNYLNL